MTGPGPIVVINPNSNQTVTDGLAQALTPLALPGAPPIEAVTLAEGPFGIETEVHAAEVIMPLVRLVTARADASAFVIACYSDPGLAACRAATAAPVFGIQESGALTALARGERFGVIALSAGSIIRHRAYLRRMGVLDRLAGERAVEMSVAATASDAHGYDRLLAAGRLLVEEDGANVVVLGCAGMAGHRAALEQALGVPVIEPTQAATTMALGAIVFS